MLNIKNAFLAVGSVAATVFVNIIGGWDTAAIMLFVLMGADIVTGVMLALFWRKSSNSVTGGVDKRVYFQGVCKKIVVIFLVALGQFADQTLGTDCFRLPIVFFFAGNEGISFLENVGEMGVPYPSFIKKALESLREAGDNGNKEV